MNDDEYFLHVCEKLWGLAEEGKALQARAPRAEGEDDDIRTRIDVNLRKRRLLLERVRELAQGSPKDGRT